MAQTVVSVAILPSTHPLYMYEDGNEWDLHVAPCGRVTVNTTGSAAYCGHGPSAGLRHMWNILIFCEMKSLLDALSLQGSLAPPAMMTTSHVIFGDCVRN
jgi:hypothetical protein